VSRRAPSESPEALAARQREHRLRERVWPRERPPANCDPWLLASEALDLMDAVRKELRPMGRAILDLEQAQELVRQLAVGPED
jgi:predicted RNA polymerase sigma factor